MKAILFLSLLMTTSAFANADESITRTCLSADKKSKIIASAESNGVRFDLTMLDVSGTIVLANEVFTLDELMLMETVATSDQEGNDLLTYNGRKYHMQFIENYDVARIKLAIYKTFDAETEILSDKIITLECTDYESN